MRTKKPAISEDDFQKQIYQLAHLAGWRVAHFRPARVGPQFSGRYATPVQFDATGFPDLVLVNRKMMRLIFIEVKAELGKVSPAQQKWIDDIRLAGKEMYVWKPSDWLEILKVLDPDCRFEIPLKGA